MAKKQATGQPRVHEPEILAPEHQEASLVESDGAQVGAFVIRSNLERFFKGATALETESRNLLTRAKAIKASPPQTQEEDANVQAFIRAARSHTKAVESYWGITQVMTSLRNKLSAGRAKGTDPATEAATIAQSVHNRYVDEANRKAREEQDRIRREAEEQARKDREAELARMEEAALKAEAESADLSDREQHFVELVANGYNTPYASAKTVGYKNPDQTSQRLMDTPKIVQAIQAKRDAIAIRQQAQAVQAAPLVVEVEEVKPEVTHHGGHDRTPWKATVTDERLLIEAILGGKHGIPTDILTIKQTKVNEYAKALGDLMNRWPGVSVVRERKTY